MNASSRAMRLVVTSPSRIHTGLLDETGCAGRLDGGFGFALGSPRLKLQVEPSGSLPSPPSSALQGLDPRRVRVTSRIPQHVGLGSHTASAMAVGTAAALIRNREVDFRRIAVEGARGGTSGIGVHVAANGGAVLDAGHQYPEEKSSFGPSSSVLAPPAALARRWAFPACWHVIHFRLTKHRGLSGPEEAAFFAENCPIPQSESLEIAGLVDACLMPAMGEGVLCALHEFVDGMQRLGLKAREWRVQPADIVDFYFAWHGLRKRSRGALAPLGLSSLGPTLYLVTDSPGREMSTLSKLGVERARITLTTVPERGTDWRWNEV
jgi:beta-ribofuranosylaminobenzene 5'-phosphate synthase